MNLISKIKNRVLLKVKSSNLQNIAQEYWSKCDNSFIGADELYVNQEKIILEHFVPKLDASNEVLDIGCCDGRFSILISEHCKYIDAFDLSDRLIRKAITSVKDRKIENINFWAQNIENLVAEKKYDHLMCMGVFTAIPNDTIVFEAIEKISKMVKKGGYILLKDSLAAEHTSYYENEDYAAIYRQESDYKLLFMKYGISVEAEYILHSTFMKGQQVASKIILMKVN